MDMPGLDAGAFVGSLRGLRNVNRITFAGNLLWPHLKRLAQGQAKPLRVLDVGSGAGDGVIKLARRAARAGLSMRFTAADINPIAVEFGREAAAAADIDVEFCVLDAVNNSMPGEIDVVISSLFLHHLRNGDARRFLERAKASAARGIVIHDLERSASGYWLAYVGVRLVSRSHVVHVDGPRSVEGSFTVDEVSAMATEAGLDGHRVERRFPFRYVLSWERTR